MLDRASVDKVDLINFNNCNDIFNSIFLPGGRCKCSLRKGSSIVSQDTGQIACVSDHSIDKSKYS